MSRHHRIGLRRPRLHIAMYLGLLALAQPAWAQAPALPERAGRGPAADASVASAAVPDAWVAQLRWRSIGPAAMGGRITALAVYESDPSTWWVATASGGLLKTTNNGISFEHQFEHEATVSLGDVAVFQGDPNIVWVGTGESNPRNSVSWGDGVYKSLDGGKTWKNVGLRGLFQTGRVLIHPTDPDIVYVAGMGRLWGENEERGVFKTTDGGATWEKVLYVDSKTGAITLAFKSDDPDTLLAAMWERQRDGFDTNTPIKPWGPGSGLYKSSDAGGTWRKITAGLPQESHIGRIGIDFYRKDPNVVYMVLESERSGLEPENAAYLGIRGEDAEVGARLTDVTKDSPADAAGLKTGDIVISLNGGTILSYNELQRELRKRVAGDSIDLAVSRERTSVLVNATLTRKPNATSQPARRGPSEAVSDSRPFGAMLGGQQPNVHDQQGPDGHEYGGVYRSDDAGETWRRINSVNPRPMYFSKVRVDPSDNNYLWVLGVDLHRSSDGGNHFTNDGARDAHPDHHALWINPRDGRHAILGNDGGVYVTFDRGERWDHLNHAAIGQFYHVTVDPRPNYNVYGGLQDNGSWGGPSRVRHNRGPLNFDWFRIGGGDGFVCRVDAEDPDQVYFTSQNGGLGRINLRTGERASIRPERAGGARLRWNWETPFILSHHNSRIFYTAANYVFRSLNRGRDLRRISPEITFTRRGSATDLAESPLDSDVLYVGSDDGALHGTRDGGKTWTLLNEFPPEKMPASDAAPEQASPDAAAETSPDTDAPPADTPAAPPTEEVAERSAPPERREPPAEPRGPGRGGAGRMLERLAELDANKDGMIQRDEVPENMQRMFDRADTNQDGVIDAAELEALRERMQQFGAGRRGQREPGSERPADAPAEAATPSAPASQAPAATSPPPAPAGADPLSGEWSGRFSMEGMPPEFGRFALRLKLAADGQVSGDLSSQMSAGPIADGKFDAATNKLTFSYTSEMGSADFTAQLAGKHLAGTLEGDGGFSMAFEADLAGPVTAGAPRRGPRRAGDAGGGRGGADRAGGGPGAGRGQATGRAAAGAALGELGRGVAFPRGAGVRGVRRPPQRRRRAVPVRVRGLRPDVALHPREHADLRRLDALPARGRRQRERALRGRRVRRVGQHRPRAELDAPEQQPAHRRRPRLRHPSDRRRGRRRHARPQPVGARCHAPAADVGGDGARRRGALQAERRHLLAAGAVARQRHARVRRPQQQQRRRDPVRPGPERRERQPEDHRPGRRGDAHARGPDAGRPPPRGVGPAPRSACGRGGGRTARRGPRRARGRRAIPSRRTAGAVGHVRRGADRRECELHPAVRCGDRPGVPGIPPVGADGGGAGAVRRRPGRRARRAGAGDRPRLTAGQRSPAGQQSPAESLLRADSCGIEPRP